MPWPGLPVHRLEPVGKRPNGLPEPGDGKARTVEQAGASEAIVDLQSANATDSPTDQLLGGPAGWSSAIQQVSKPALRQAYPPAVNWDTPPAKPQATQAERLA